MSDTAEKGLKIFGEVYGRDKEEMCRAMIENDPDFSALHAKWSMEWAFGTVWAREGLPRKMRSLAVLGMMIGLKQPEEIKYHTIMGLANGLTRAEIEEIFFTAMPYCGIPAANTAKAAMVAAFAEVEEKAGCQAEAG